jgi:hypothetical protein
MYVEEDSRRVSCYPAQIKADQSFIRLCTLCKEAWKVSFALAGLLTAKFSVILVAEC